jgi:hypothetical protein
MCVCVVTVGDGATRTIPRTASPTLEHARVAVHVARALSRHALRCVSVAEEGGDSDTSEEGPALGS